MRASGLIGYVYDFSFNYGAIAVDDTLDIQKYLTKKNGIVEKMLKKLFITVVPFFNLFLNTSSLECMSMINQECRARPKMIDTNANEPVFYPHSIKVINVVAAVIISIIPMLNCVFLILLKKLMSKYLI